MKLLTNLPGNLRALFGFLRIVTIATGFFWMLNLVFGFVVLPHFGADGSVGMAVGEVVLQVDPQAIQLKSANAKPDALTLKTVRATLHANPGGQDAALRSTLLQTTVPFMLVMTVTAYVLFTALRRLCGNWEVGDVFNEENLQLVRRIGMTLVISSLMNAVLAVWAAATMGAFLHDHVTIGAGLRLFEFGGLTPFDLPAGVMSIQTGLITGCLVLMLTAAFRQGLKLKAENDLTV